jgi:hypothetical protein
MRTPARFVSVFAVAALLASVAVTGAQETAPYGRFGPRTLGSPLAPRERTRFDGGIQRGPSGNILGLQREHPRFIPSIPEPPAMQEFLEFPPGPRIPVDPRVPAAPRVPRVPRVPELPPAPVEPVPPALPPAFPRRPTHEVAPRTPAPRTPAARTPAPRTPPEPVPDIWFRAPRGR